jgi:hypothetical protein
MSAIYVRLSASRPTRLHRVGAGHSVNCAVPDGQGCGGFGARRENLITRSYRISVRAGPTLVAGSRYMRKTRPRIAVPLSMLAWLTQVDRWSCALLASGAVRIHGAVATHHQLSDRGRQRTFDPVRGPGDGDVLPHVARAGVS